LLGAFSLSTWLFQDYTILTLKSKEKEGENTVQGAFSLSTWLFQDYTILTLKSKESEAENTVQGAAHKLNKPASCCNISDLM